MKSSGKRKLSLIGTIISSLVMVGTASVATFAWFQASASATVTATSTSTTITTSKPDDYSFFAYKGNTNPSHTKTNTFGTDFTLITASNLAAETSFVGMSPNDIKTFALSYSEHTSGESVSLSITKLITKNANDENASKHRYIAGGTTEINIGWAMDIYSMFSSDGSGYGTFVTSRTGTDKFTYDVNNTSVISGSKTNHIITLTTPISLYNATQAGSSGYVFFSVVFSNSNTTYYRECNSAGTEYYSIPQTSQNTRYFTPGTSGNSNCYENLTFALNEMSFNF